VTHETKKAMAEMMKGQPHLMTQNAKTVDPSKLTALTPEVVSLSRRRSVVGRIVPWVPRSSFIYGSSTPVCLTCCSCTRVSLLTSSHIVRI
jgi:hypothetical protein